MHKVNISAIKEVDVILWKAFFNLNDDDYISFEKLEVGFKFMDINVNLYTEDL
jgi:hypothetical protein